MVSSVAQSGSGAQTGSIYVNTDVKGTGQWTGRTNGNTVSKFTVVGNSRYPINAERGFSGSAGPVLVYNRPLTQTEINDIYFYFQPTYNL